MSDAIILSISATSSILFLLTSDFDKRIAAFSISSTLIAVTLDVNSSFPFSSKIIPVKIILDPAPYRKNLPKDYFLYPEIITPNGKQPVTLKFREVIINLTDTGKNVNILSIENYRNSENGELSDEEEVAFQMLLKKEHPSCMGKNKYND